MIKNYFKIAWRNLIKGKLHSFINLFGLGFGTAIAFLIISYVKDEWSYDKFHSNSERIYRASVKEHFRGDVFFNTITPYLLGTEIRDNFPEVEGMARYLTMNTIIRQGAEVRDELVHVADASFLEIFDFPVLEGSGNPLSELNQVLITPEISKKYFGNSSPLNQTITLQVGGEWKEFIVSGIIAQAPSNSSLQFDMIIPFENTRSFFSEAGRNCWTCVSVETYFLLSRDADLQKFNSQVATFIDQKVSKIYESGEYIIGFQPLEDIHLNNDYPTGIVPVSDSRYPYILSAIALLLLFLACINFTSLSIGRSISRAREVGIRKVAGASRVQLMGQFWSEAVLTVIIAVAFGILIARALLPQFNILADKELTIEPNMFLFGSAVGISLIVGLLAGIYPALVLSAFKPIQALEGRISKLGMNKHSILKVLVGVQFGLSVILIISTIIMQNQLRFLQNKNLGYEKEYVMAFPYQVSGAGLINMWEDGQMVFERMESSLQGHSGIRDMSISSHTLGTLGWSRIGFTEEESEKFRSFLLQKIDESYVDMMGIQLVDGRNFSEDMGRDSRSVIINQAMAREFDLEPAVGSFLPGPFRDFQVIGVTEDFNHSSLHDPITPLVMAMDGIGLMRRASDHVFTDQPNPKISVKVESDNLPGTLNDIKAAWAEAAPEQPFNYYFIDDKVDQQYRKETRLGQIIGFGTIIAIIIACLGLLGISTLTVAYRTKEIGIRKVLGATSKGIVRLIAFDFLKLVLLAILIASPVAWWVMKEWLQDFAFNVGIQWWVFMLACGLAIGLAFATISTQSLRAAFMNPAKTLRDE